MIELKFRVILVFFLAISVASASESVDIEVIGKFMDFQQKRSENSKMLFQFYHPLNRPVTPRKTTNIPKKPTVTTQSNLPTITQLKTE